ncbi:TIP41-LIKE PROTEIN [Salix purpurea]|uniref:TIP41-LIKE PROTEIN n=1 Tax=Salix purpurea TaxID=77065 RepID=A0A9Q0WXD1_SALPP|nr:TIP41-LIKE PROTEIN [Salix purpurea]
MAGADDGGEVRFEEAISCLPSLVLDEAIWDSKEYVKQQQHHHHHQYRSSLHKLPLYPHPQRSKSSPRPNCRTKYATNWASGGPGMQAVFLDSGKKSLGTGVFLPQRAGTNMQSSKKPACAPVLLPARVVQALNINVHEIGLHISRRQDAKNKSKGRDCNSFKNKNGKDVSPQCAVVLNNENSSPEIFLPKEWTY